MHVKLSTVHLLVNNGKLRVEIDLAVNLVKISQKLATLQTQNSVDFLNIVNSLPINAFNGVRNILGLFRFLKKNLLACVWEGYPK